MASKIFFPNSLISLATDLAKRSDKERVECYIASGSCCVPLPNAKCNHKQPNAMDLKHVKCNHKQKERIKKNVKTVGGGAVGTQRCACVVCVCGGRVRGGRGRDEKIQLNHT